MRLRSLRSFGAGICVASALTLSAGCSQDSAFNTAQSPVTETKEQTVGSEENTSSGGAVMETAATLSTVQAESESGSALGQVITAQVVQKRVPQQPRFDLVSDLKRQEVVVAQQQQKIEWALRQPFLKPGSLEKTQGTGEKPQ